MELFISPNNSNKLEPDTYDRIKSDVERNGFLDPDIYVASDGEIISGNHRYQIAQELGLIGQLNITNLGELSDLERFRLSEMYNTRGVADQAKLMIKCYLLYQKLAPKNKKLTAESKQIFGQTTSLIAHEIAVTAVQINRYVRTGYEMFEHHPWLIEEVGSKDPNVKDTAAPITALMAYYLTHFNKSARVVDDKDMPLKDRDKFMKEFVKDAKEHHRKTGRPMGADTMQAKMRIKLQEIQGIQLANLDDCAWASIWYPLKKIESLRHVIEEEIQLGTYSRDLLKLRPVGRDVGMNRDRRVSSFHQSIAFQMIRNLTRDYNMETKSQTFNKFKVVDPCCGMGIRIVTPLMMRHEAYGFDVSQNTISKVKEKYPEYADNFFVHDSVNTPLPFDNNSVDLVFACPPYWNIEKYDEVAGQLSQIKTYENFLNEYEKIIKESIRITKNYIVWVVANFRGNKGDYYPFCWNTESLFYKYGMPLVDKVILGHDISKPTGGTASLKKNHTRSAHDEMFIFQKRFKI